MYKSILEFRATHLRKWWPETYELLGVEKLRGRIEANVKAAYDKLCLSSLDSDYPRRLLNQIGASARDNGQIIRSNVNRMRYERMKEDREAWQREMEALNGDEVLTLMDDPMPGGTRRRTISLKRVLRKDSPPRHALALDP